MENQYKKKIESQFSRESQVEEFFITILARNFKKDDVFLEKYKNFKEVRSIPVGITWEMMKEKYDWGYRKGSAISSLITWIYLRPDIKKCLDNRMISLENLTTSFILNEHYFLVEKNAIEFLKNHCSSCDNISLHPATPQRKIEDEYSESSSSENDHVSLASELSYQALKRRRMSGAAPIGIDDIATESRN